MVSVFEFRFSDFGFRISGFGFQISVLGSRGFVLDDFGCMLSGFGCGDLISHNASIEWFLKVNCPTKYSTYCFNQ